MLKNPHLVNTCWPKVTYVVYTVLPSSSWNICDFNITWIQKIYRLGLVSKVNIINVDLLNVCWPQNMISVCWLDWCWPHVHKIYHHNNISRFYQRINFTCSISWFMFFICRKISEIWSTSVDQMLTKCWKMKSLRFFW